MITVSTHTPIPFADVSADLKKFVRVDNAGDDTLLELLWLAAQDEWISITQNYLGDATIIYECVSNTYINLPFYPVTAVSEVRINGDVDADYTTETLDSRYLVKPSVAGSEAQITYTVGEAIGAEVKLALFQHVKFAYDFGDNLPADKVRYFDRIAMRYKNVFAA